MGNITVMKDEIKKYSISYVNYYISDPEEEDNWALHVGGIERLELFIEHMSKSFIESATAWLSVEYADIDKETIHSIVEETILNELAIKIKKYRQHFKYQNI